MEQACILVNQISQYAARGTLLTPSQVHEHAEVLAEQKLGINWVGRNITRTSIHLLFFEY